MYKHGNVGTKDSSMIDKNEGANQSRNVDNSRTSRRYNLQYIPDNFLMSQNCQTALIKVIEKLEANLESKSDLDKLYDDVCDLIIKEMDNVIPFKDVFVGRDRKSFKSHKPYWTEDLANVERYD
jgi:hypothetical protein